MGGCRVRRSGHDFTIEGGFRIGVLSHLHWEILCVLVPKAVPEREEGCAFRNAHGDTDRKWKDSGFSHCRLSYSMDM